MSQIIIAGRNGGYPTMENLPELSEIPDCPKPYPQYMMRTVSGSYPKPVPLPDMAYIPDCAPPYPQYMMRCISAVNDGYPMPIPVSGVSERLVSHLYYAEKQITAMYYGGQKLTLALCGGEKVFGTEYFYETL